MVLILWLIGAVEAESYQSATIPESMTAGTTPTYLNESVNTIEATVDVDIDIHKEIADNNLVPEKSVSPVFYYHWSEDNKYVINEILKVFPDAPIMVKVAMCESGLNPLADRANLNVDVGLFQINQVHLARLASLGLDRRDMHDNLTYARMLYDDGGLSAWYMSEYCWGRYL